MTRSLRRHSIVVPIVGTVLIAVGLIGIGLAATTLIGGGAVERLVTTMLIDAVVVIGMQIFIGNTGVFSFGHVGFGAIAGYVFALLVISPADKTTRIPNAPAGIADVQVDPWVGIVIAATATLAVAFVVGLGLVRSGARSGAVSATVITLALLFVTHEVASSWTTLTGGNRGGLTFGIGETLQSRWPILAALGGALLVAKLFAWSRSGRLAVAAREDDLAARAMGINPAVQQTIALLVSVLVVSVGASLRVYELGSILPDSFFFDYTLLTLVMLVVGGRQSVTGAALGVVVVTVVREAARRLGSNGYEFFGLGLDSPPIDWVFREGLPTVVLGLAMLGFMVWRPSGLVGDWELDRWPAGRYAARTDTPQPLSPTPPVEATHLVARQVGVDFGGFTALAGVDLDVDNTSVVGLIGPNGAGKTTLVNALTGLARPTKGTIRLGTRDITGLATHHLARAGLVRTFQNLRLFGSLTVIENVEVAAMVARRHRHERAPIDAEALVVAAGLDEYRDRRASQLDYGNARRLELARAAAMLPTFLLIDEPTSGMSDAESLAMVSRIREIAAAAGAGVIVIDHDLAFMNEICDVVYCMDMGEVIAHGPPEVVQADQRVRLAYLGPGGPAT